MKLNPLWDLFFVTMLVVVGLWYFLEKPSRLGISKLHQAFFYLAFFLSAIVLVGPIPHLAVRIFWVHMVQHILLMMLISPLIILSSPIKIALNSQYPKIRLLVRRFAAVSLIRSIFRPQVGFFIFLATLIATHFSPLADAGMVNSNVHSLELILFLIAGLIYYYPVLEGNPTPFPVSYATRLASLFAMMLPETMTGFFLYSGNKLLHSVSMNMADQQLSPLRDQHTGGALMWAMGMLIDSMWVVLAARDWFANEKRMADLDDLENAKFSEAIE